MFILVHIEFEQPVALAIMNHTVVSRGHNSIKITINPVFMADRLFIMNDLSLCAGQYLLKA